MRQSFAEPDRHGLLHAQAGRDGLVAALDLHDISGNCQGSSITFATGTEIRSGPDELLQAGIDFEGGIVLRRAAVSGNQTTGARWQRFDDLGTGQTGELPVPPAFSTPGASFFAYPDVRGNVLAVSQPLVGEVQAQWFDPHLAVASAPFPLPSWPSLQALPGGGDRRARRDLVRPAPALAARRRGPAVSRHPRGDADRRRPGRGSQPQQRERHLGLVQPLVEQRAALTGPQAAGGVRD